MNTQSNLTRSPTTNTLVHAIKHPATRLCAATAAAGATYAFSHHSQSFDVMIGATLSIGSGVCWAFSAALPLEMARHASRLNFIAACFAAMSGICLLP